MGNSNMSNSHYNGVKPESFWEFLGRYTLIIPMIQRDYAQGRIEKFELRKEFFGQIIGALKHSAPIKLDFVFGCPLEKDSTHIQPLDGQQRLTTLWILHWYLAYKTSNLNFPDVKQRLSKFSYHTRTSSREFCQKLCEPLIISTATDENRHDISILEIIISQPWFSRRFKMDPTVNSILRTLSDPMHNSGFEQLLDGHDLVSYWEKLTGAECPIRFFFKSTGEIDIPDPDDLYIKMNARGKKLTTFENFKADLYSFKINDKYPIFRENIKELVTKKGEITGIVYEEKEVKSFISRFENEWINLFWSLRHHTDNIVDHLVMEFFNRITLSFILKNKNYDDPRFEKLITHISEHKNYTSIATYNEILSLDLKKYFFSIINGIIRTNLSALELNSIFEKVYTFTFFPIYEKNKDQNVYSIKEKNETYHLSDITVKRIVAFYAASLYFIFLNENLGEFNKRNFIDWILFCRNLMENSGIDTYSTAQSLISILTLIGKNSLDIVNFLNFLDISSLNVTGKLLFEQIKEEKEKAKKIFESRQIENPENDIEILIRDAEFKYPFGGSIRFLFTDELGEFNWDDFKKKKRNFDLILSVPIETKERITPVAFRSLLSYVSNWNDLGSIGLNSSYSEWRKILINNPSWMRAVHQLLIYGLNGSRLKKFNSPFPDELQNATHVDLVRSKFLHQTIWGDFYFKLNEHMAVIYRSSVGWKKYLLGTPRNRLIAQGVKTGDIDIDVVQSQLLSDKSHLWGESFYFDIKGNNSSLIFWWNNTSVRRGSDDPFDIYLVGREDGHDYFPGIDSYKDYAISIPLNITYNCFIYQLKKLLKKANQYKEKDVFAGKKSIPL